MKIIIVIDNLSGGGGVNSFVFDLCQALHRGQTRNGGQVPGAQVPDPRVTLIGILGSNQDEEEVARLRSLGIRVECLGAVSKMDAVLHSIPILRKMVREISDKEPAILNLHLKLSVLIGGLASVGLKNVRCVETYHNTYHHYHLQYFIMSPIMKKYICVSATAKEEMHRRFKTPESKAVAIPNGVSRNGLRAMAGVPVEHEAPGEPGTPESAEHNKNNTPSVVSVGRLSYEKNIHKSVAAFASVDDVDFTYSVVGDGPQWKEISETAGKSEKIKMIGAVSRTEVLRILSHADLVVMPSLWEGRSILQLEAAAFDTPFMLSDVPGLREPFGEDPLKADEMFRVCSFGYLVHTNNELSYQGALRHFIAHPEIRDEMRSYVNRMSCENDISMVAERYLEQFEKVLTK